MVEPHQINKFAEQQLDLSVKLAIARDLQRMWSGVLNEPLPTDLRRLIDRLEMVTGRRSAAACGRVSGPAFRSWSLGP